ncbi:hypothetical protein ACF09E_17250 [Streptomyces sp. NPDC014891]|uniref:hypothetical protein n=1 Tax=Streptomyces sp. NPDC014891 TaxID=3364929 RepID=UPI0037015024
MARGVRGTWCGTLILIGALAGGTSGCGPAEPPAPGDPSPATSTPAPSPTGEGGRPEPSATRPSPSTSPAGTPPRVTLPPADPPSDPQPTGVLVEVVVDGGLAGVRNKLVVQHDGSWSIRSGTEPPRTGRQTPAQAAELRAALADPAYARIPERPTGRPVPDGFQYRVTYRHRLVVAQDGEEERPAALRRVFAALPEGGPPTRP